MSNIIITVPCVIVGDNALARVCCNIAILNGPCCYPLIENNVNTFMIVMINKLHFYSKLNFIIFVAKNSAQILKRI